MLDIDTAYTLSGIIMMVVIGGAIGNYATSVVYRLPLGKTPFEKHPYCGDCGLMLGPKDLMPVLSYIASRGKCRGCGVKIRPSYVLIELASIGVCVSSFLRFDLSERFFLVAAIGMFLIIHMALIYHERRYLSLILTYIAALGALHAALQGASLFLMVQSGFMMLFLAVVGWRIAILCGVASYKAPAEIWWFGIIGLIAPFTQAMWLLLWGGIYILPVVTKEKKMLLFSVATSVHVYLMLL